MDAKNVHPSTVQNASSLGKSQSWDWMNQRPGKTEQKASDAQLRLYDDYEDPFCYSEDGTRALVRAPKDVLQGIWTVPTHVLLSCHGGGGTTGVPSYEPNFKTHIASILATQPFIVEPLTKLLPEHSGAEAHAAHDTLYKHIEEGRLERAMRKHWPNMKARPQWDNMLAMGVTSGGHWAIYAWTQQRKNMVVKGVYVMYGLLSPYCRHSDDEYRGVRFSKRELHETALELLAETANRRPSGSSIFGRVPPEGMANLPLTAVRTRVSRNGGPPKYETLWFICWQHASVLDWCKHWLEQWFKETLKGCTERDIQWKNILEERVGDHYLTELEIWAKDVFKGRIELIEGSRAMDDSRTVFIDAKQIAEKLGGSLKNLGLRYDSDANALSCTVPEAQLPRPLNNPHWFLVHDKKDQFVPQGDTETLSNVLQIMQGDDAVHYRSVEGSDPPHGFDDYEGSEDFMAQLSNKLGWKRRVAQFD
ncbi:hypothetical protein PMIN04_011604 [Paraphaeosphaeria minitans]